MAELFHDIDPFGEETNEGEAREYLDSQAIKTALTLWLTSKRGDYIENLSEGGMIKRFLFKNLTGENEEKLKFRLQTAFETYFSEYAELVRVNIIPNYVQRFTEIHIKYRDKLTNEVDTLSIYPKIENQKQLVSYEIVEFVGENLFSYAKAKKPDLLNKKLIYNVEENAWIWGNSLKLINFNFEDPYFEQILSYVNDL